MNEAILHWVYSRVKSLLGLSSERSINERRMQPRQAWFDCLKLLPECQITVLITKMCLGFKVALWLDLNLLFDHLLRVRDLIALSLLQELVGVFVA